MTTDLDSFEQQLLTELRADVELRGRSRGRSRGAFRARRWRGSGRRRPVTALLASTAAVGAAVVVIVSTWATPAFAVDGHAGGTVTVEIHRLEDPEGLARALAERGVTSDIRYLGENKMCGPRQLTEAPSAPDSVTTFSVGSGGISMTLDARDVSDGQTVVIAASRIRDGVYGEVAIAAGPVPPCTVVPLTASMRNDT